MHNAPTVSDSLVYDALTDEQKGAVQRLYGLNQRGDFLLEEAYVRGHRSGVAVGHSEMLREIRKCMTCTTYGILRCKKHGAEAP